jgi:hypothetical protein
MTKMFEIAERADRIKKRLCNIASMLVQTYHIEATSVETSDGGGTPGYLDFSHENGVFDLYFVVGGSRYRMSLLDAYYAPYAAIMVPDLLNKLKAAEAAYEMRLGYAEKCLNEVSQGTLPND